jgi:hypothetical protein
LYNREKKTKDEEEEKEKRRLFWRTISQEKKMMAFLGFLNRAFLWIFRTTQLQLFWQ